MSVAPQAEVATGEEVTRHRHSVEELLRSRFGAIASSWPSFADAGPTAEDAAPAGTGLIDSLDLPSGLASATFAGGKRLRPTLAFLGFWAGGGVTDSADHQRVISISAALELLHVFALVHDDVMDQSRSRRGRPTAHRSFAEQHSASNAAGDSARFGENLAILLGDLAHAEAERLIADCPVAIRAHWATMITELITGQFGDLAGAADRSRDVGRAQLIAGLKSGGYTIRRPLELGALAAGAGPARMHRLSEFGQHVGIAFALRDDLLGVWGDPEVTGKPAGDDLLEGKPTVIIALAAHWLPPAHQPLLDRVGTSDLHPDDIAELQYRLRDCGVEAEVEKMITHHVERGIACLGSDILTSNPSDDPDPIVAAPRDELIRLASMVGWRDR